MKVKTIIQNKKYSITHTSNTKAYISIGDSLDVPIQMIDSTTGEGVEITPSMSFSCSIVNLLGGVSHKVNLTLISYLIVNQTNFYIRRVTETLPFI